MNKACAQQIAELIKTPSEYTIPGRARQRLGLDAYSAAIREGILIPSQDTGGLDLTHDLTTIHNLRATAGVLEDKSLPSANAKYSPSRGREFI
jgi:hypothetical protein